MKCNPSNPPSSRLSKVMQDSHGNRDKNSHKIVGKKKRKGIVVSRGARKFVNNNRFIKLKASLAYMK